MTDQISTVMVASETPAPNTWGKISKKPATRAVKAKSQGKAARSAKAVAKPKTEPATTVVEGLNGPDPELMKSQSQVWNTLMDRYFRLDISGWKNLPDQPATTVAEGLNGPDPALMNSQSRVWNTLMDRYFRLDISGWENLPDQPSLLIGVHYPELAVWYHAAPEAIPAPTFA